MDHLTEFVMGVALLGLVLAGLRILSDIIRRAKQRVFLYFTLGVSGAILLIALAVAILPLIVSWPAALQVLAGVQAGLLIAALILAALGQIQSARTERALREKLKEVEGKRDLLEQTRLDEGTADRASLREIAAQTARNSSGEHSMTVRRRLLLLPEAVEAD
ncbi:MAG TPA: hypothetical protein VF807_10090 [Ktedonobacterales bacterium]